MSNPARRTYEKLLPAMAEAILSAHVEREKQGSETAFVVVEAERELRVIGYSACADVVLAADVRHIAWV